MRFEVGNPGREEHEDVFFLRPTGWDDWFKFSTLYDLVYFDAHGMRHDIGGVKIGEVGLRPASAGGDHASGYRTPSVPAQFTEFPTTLFSLGQDTSYYEALSEIGENFREASLRSLRDIAYDPELLSAVKSEDVTRISLLREVPLSTVESQFHRLARGGAKLTDYSFSFRMKSQAEARVSLRFAVVPGSRPPTNVHVLVGRNGVGKSTTLNSIANALMKMSRRGAADETGDDEARYLPVGADLSNIVSVSFSAFDAFEPVTVSQDRTKGLTYHYVGLKKIAPKKDESATKDHAALSREMSMAAKNCLQGARRARWQRAIDLLESDPVFASLGLSRYIAGEVDEQFLLDLPSIFRRLSSGHKIVLLTITRLVETVVEKSLVLLDEPEAHLHPPLLSAFTRALSDLLTNRNGMAIVATHSPVVLQEVPRECVWKLERNGLSAWAARPSIETFGENVGTLTNEVFGLEVTATGFHRMLFEAAQNYGSYEEALDSFEGEVGAEGRAILRAQFGLRARGK